MSAHLSNLFGDELSVPEWQRLSYLEAYLGKVALPICGVLLANKYLERLSRYQLHVQAAYIRKSTMHISIQERTQVRCDIGNFLRNSDEPLDANYLLYELWTMWQSYRERGFLPHLWIDSQRQVCILHSLSPHGFRMCDLVSLHRKYQ